MSYPLGHFVSYPLPHFAKILFVILLIKVSRFAKNKLKIILALSCPPSDSVPVMSQNTTNGQGDSALEKSFWKIQHSSITAGQDIVAPDGKSFFACYWNEGKIAIGRVGCVCRDVSEQIPERIRERIRERFSFLFHFPVQERNAILAAMPVEYIDVSRHE